VAFEETLRWPTKLDRAAIEQRLIEARNAATRNGWDDIATLLAGVEKKSAPELAKAVMAALECVQKKPEQRDFTRQLEMVALNLKNLR